jgi:hypothetical protein
MLKRLTILALIVAGVALAFSAEASGALTPEEEEVGHAAANPYTSPFGLSVRASNGYWVTVNSAKGGRVQVEASGPEGSVTYAAPGNVSETDIQADLGKYGQIDMQWVPSGQVREIRTKCHYKGVMRRFYDTGSYVGTLRFKGGGGFTSVSLGRVPWRRSWYSALGACGYSLSTAEPGAGVVINAGKRGHISAPVHFSVYRAHRGAMVEYSARSETVKGSIKIERSAYAEGSPHSLTLTAANGRTTATISPHAPFYGGATFERVNGSKGTLIGKLGAEFPDHTKVSLAGKGFEARLRLESINIHPG